MSPIVATERIYQTVIELAATHAAPLRSHLDVGAGRERLVEIMNPVPMLLGRTIVVAATKPKKPLN